MRASAMDFGYRDRVAVVTGGASGIGEAVVRRLVAEGASVVAGDVDRVRLAELREELGDACATVDVDVTREGDVDALVGTAVQRFGRLDAAFNVAGITATGPLTELTEASWDRQVDVCLKGVFLAMKHEARAMLAGGDGGAIVNVASINAVRPAYGAAAYGAAKAGVCHLTQAGAAELGPRGIRVNAVLPGLTETPMTTGVLAVPGALDALVERIPLRRAATADEQAGAMLFLGSRAASYVTGVNLLVDGGWAMSAYPDLAPFLDAAARPGSDEQRLRDFYAAHNGRDADALLDLLHEDVRWPDSWRGGDLVGRAAVVQYWAERWPQLTGTVEPVDIARRADGRIAVRVRQRVRDAAGDNAADGPATHVFTLADDGRVVAMDVEPDPPSEGTRQ